MSIRFEQCSHFAVPSSDTSVELARPQFRHFQGRSELLTRRLAFSPTTGTGVASCGMQSWSVEEIGDVQGITRAGAGPEERL